MNCKLCGEDRKLIKAHVVPAAFFAKNGNDSAFESFLHTVDSNGHAKRAPAGIYDKELLCHACEQRFQCWDEYGARLLVKEFDRFVPVLRDGKPMAWRLDEYDYHLLKLFIIGVLWRASASTHIYFRDTRLGPFEVVAKQAVLNADPGDPNLFATVMVRWHSDSVPEYQSQMHLSPYKDRIDGVNVLRIYMGEYIAYVKVDKRPYSDAFSFFQLSDQIPLVITARDLDVSDEFNETNVLLIERGYR